MWLKFWVVCCNSSTYPNQLKNHPALANHLKNHPFQPVKGPRRGAFSVIVKLRRRFVESSSWQLAAGSREPASYRDVVCGHWRPAKFDICCWNFPWPHSLSLTFHTLLSTLGLNCGLYIKICRYVHCNLELFVFLGGFLKFSCDLLPSHSEHQNLNRCSIFDWEEIQSDVKVRWKYSRYFYISVFLLSFKVSDWEPSNPRCWIPWKLFRFKTFLSEILTLI